MAVTWYRGDDRRMTRSVEAALGRSWLLAGVVLAVVQTMAIVMVATSGVSLRFTESLASLRMAAFVLAVAVTVTAFLHWRAVGHAASLRVAAAASLLVAWAGVGVAHPDGVVTGGPAVASMALSGAALGWFAAAVRGPEVNSHLRPWRQLMLVAGAGLGAVAISLLTTDLGPATAFWGAKILGLGWTVAGILGVMRAMDRSHVLMGWVSWAIIATGLSEFIHALGVSGNTDALLAAHAIRVSALLVALTGVALALSRFAVARRGDVHGMRLLGHRKDADQVDAARVRAHELRNALMAIEGTHLTLQHHGERLSHDQRDELQRAFFNGLTHLRQLLEETPAEPSLDVVQVGHVVTERALLAQSRGVPVQVMGDVGLAAVGQASLLAQVVDNLVVNAERHGNAGPGQPVTITLGQQGDRVVVQVADRGPGVPVQHREAIFDPGHRLTSDVAGDGLGLHIARDLMRRQKGHLRYEDRAGGGACFAMSLSAAVDRFVGVLGPGAHEVDDGC
jgi:signal transduction histidine kinase